MLEGEFSVQDKNISPDLVVMQGPKVVYQYCNDKRTSYQHFDAQNVLIGGASYDHTGEEFSRWKKRSNGFVETTTISRSQLRTVGLDVTAPHPENPENNYRGRLLEFSDWTFNHGKKQSIVKYYNGSQRSHPDNRIYYDNACPTRVWYLGYVGAPLNNPTNFVPHGGQGTLYLADGSYVVGVFKDGFPKDRNDDSTLYYKKIPNGSFRSFKITFKDGSIQDSGGNVISETPVEEIDWNQVMMEEVTLTK